MTKNTVRYNYAGNSRKLGSADSRSSRDYSVHSVFLASRRHAMNPHPKTSADHRPGSHYRRRCRYASGWGLVWGMVLSLSWQYLVAMDPTSFAVSSPNTEAEADAEVSSRRIPYRGESAPLIAFARNYREPWLLPASGNLGEYRDEWISLSPWRETIADPDGANAGRHPWRQTDFSAESSPYPQICNGSPLQPAAITEEKPIPLFGTESPYWTDSSVLAEHDVRPNPDSEEIWAGFSSLVDDRSLATGEMAEPREFIQIDPQLDSAACVSSPGGCRWNPVAYLAGCESWGWGGTHGPTMYGSMRELAPVQAISPRLRARAVEKDPWTRVLQIEHMPSVTCYTGSLHCPPVIEYRASDESVNQVRLQADPPVARMQLKTQPKAGRMPEERMSKSPTEQPVLAHIPGTERGWEGRGVHWNAPQTTHAPLYFEEIALERSGYSRGYLQPFVSGVEFFTTVPLLPGLMTIDPPMSTQYELGEIRPGSPAPYMGRKPEWTYQAVAVELATVLGFAFIIP